MGNRLTTGSTAHGATHDSPAVATATVPVDKVDENQATGVTNATAGSTASGNDETDLRQLRSENATLRRKLQQLLERPLRPTVSEGVQTRREGSDTTFSDLNKDCIIEIAKRLDGLGPFFSRADAGTDSTGLSQSTYHDLITTEYNCKDKVALANALVGTDLDGIIFGEPGTFFWKKLKFTGKAGEGEAVDLGNFLSLLSNGAFCFVENLDLSMECKAYRARLAKKKKNHRAIADVLRADGFDAYYARNVMKMLRSIPAMSQLECLQLDVDPRPPTMAQVLGTFIAKVPELKGLILGSNSVDDEVLHLMTNNFRHLEGALLHYSNDDAREEDLLAFLNSKAHLTMVHFVSVSSSFVGGWLQPGSETAARITNLTLEITETGDYDHAIRAISGCNHLVTLALHNAEVTDAFLPYIGRLTNLEELFLSLSRVTAHGLEGFFENASWFSLRELRLYCMSEEPAESGDQAVRALIARNPKLQRIYLCFERVCFQVSCAGFDQVNSLHGLSSFTLYLRNNYSNFHTAAFLNDLQPKSLPMLTYLKVFNRDPYHQIRRTQMNQFHTKFPKCEVEFDQPLPIIEDEPPIDFSDSDSEEDEGGGFDGDNTDEAGDAELDGGANDNAPPGFDHNYGDQGSGANSSSAPGQDLAKGDLDEWSEKGRKTVEEPMFVDDSSDLTYFNHDSHGLLTEKPDELGVPTYGAKRGTTDEAFNSGRTRCSMTDSSEDVDSEGKSGDPTPCGIEVASGLSSGVVTGLGPCRDRGAAAEELGADAKPDSSTEQQKIDSVEGGNNATKDT